MFVIERKVFVIFLVSVADIYKGIVDVQSSNVLLEIREDHEIWDAGRQGEDLLWDSREYFRRACLPDDQDIFGAWQEAAWNSRRVERRRILYVGQEPETCGLLIYIGWGGTRYGRNRDRETVAGRVQEQNGA